jgi:hypothetical protein
MSRELMKVVKIDVIDGAFCLSDDRILVKVLFWLIHHKLFFTDPFVLLF